MDRRPRKPICSRRAGGRGRSGDLVGPVGQTWRARDVAGQGRGRGQDSQRSAPRDDRARPTGRGCAGAGGGARCAAGDRPWPGRAPARGTTAARRVRGPSAAARGGSCARRVGGDGDHLERRPSRRRHDVAGLSGSHDGDVVTQLARSLRRAQQHLLAAAEVAVVGGEEDRAQPHQGVHSGSASRSWPRTQREGDGEGRRGVEQHLAEGHRHHRHGDERRLRGDRLQVAGAGLTREAKEGVGEQEEHQQQRDPAALLAHREDSCCGRRTPGRAG